jgi:hypothetical protein
MIRTWRTGIILIDRPSSQPGLEKLDSLDDLDDHVLVRLSQRTEPTTWIIAHILLSTPALVQGGRWLCIRHYHSIALYYGGYMKGFKEHGNSGQSYYDVQECPTASSRKNSAQAGPDSACLRAKRSTRHQILRCGVSSCASQTS